MGWHTERKNRAIDQFLDRLEKEAEGESVNENPKAPDSILDQLSKAWNADSDLRSSSPSGKPSEKSGPAPTQIGGFRIIRPLGEGGFGTVYLATEEATGRTVALKLLRGQRRNAKVQLFRESVLSSELRHPSILPSYQFDEVDGVAFYTMEYVEGRSLHETISWMRSKLFDQGNTPRNPLDIPMQFTEFGESRERYGEFWVRTATRIAEALEFLHANQLVHRDVKPSNILINTQGEPRLTDLGLAQYEDAVKDDGMLGTYPYMSPEQIQGKEVDPQSDLFSFGATFYEALTLRRAFAGDNGREVTQAILKSEPIAPHEINPAIPRALERIVLKCLKKDKRDRYRNAAELVRDLKTIGDLRDTRSSQRLQLVLAGSLVIVAAIGAWMLSRPVNVETETATLPPTQPRQITQAPPDRPIELENSIPVSIGATEPRKSILPAIERPVVREAPPLTREPKPPVITTTPKMPNPYRASALGWPGSDLYLDLVLEPKQEILNHPVNLRPRKPTDAGAYYDAGAVLREMTLGFWEKESRRKLNVLGLFYLHSQGDWDLDLRNQIRALVDEYRARNKGTRLIVTGPQNNADSEDSQRELVKMIYPMSDGSSVRSTLRAESRTWQPRVNHEIGLIKKSLSQGKLVILTPEDLQGSELAMEKRFLAALAMLIREPGDPIYVSSTPSDHKLDWSSWPEKLGSPIGLFHRPDKNSATLIREFERGTLTLHMNQSLLPEAANSFVQIDWK